MILIEDRCETPDTLKQFDYLRGLIVVPFGGILIVNTKAGIA